MGNVTFYHQFLEGVSLSASSGSAAGHDVSQLLDRNPNHTWTSANTANDQTVVMDFGAPYAADSIVIDNHNFATAGFDTIYLEYSTDGATWTSYHTYTGSFLTEQPLSENFSATQTYRYWRLRFHSSGTPSAAPSIGNISLGTKIQMSVPYNSDPKHGEDFNTTNSRRAVDSTPYTSQLYAGLEVWELTWSTISDADQTSVLTLANSVRARFRPFYFMDADGSITLVYLTQDKNLITRKAYSQYDTGTLPLEAFLTNTIAARL